MPYTFNVKVRNQLTRDSVNVEWYDGSKLIAAQSPAWEPEFVTQSNTLAFTLTPHDHLDKRCIAVCSSGNITAEKRDPFWILTITNPGGLPAAGDGEPTTTNVTISEDQP